MSAVFRELGRIVKHGGYVAFEVGEVRHGSVYLEEQTVPCGVAAGFTPELILINSQQFTKTANCWGVDNNSKGTNTNRIVLFRRDTPEFQSSALPVWSRGVRRVSASVPIFPL